MSKHTSKHTKSNPGYANLEAMPVYHIRQVKHQYFTDEDVAGMSFEARLALIGLWTIADKNGNFLWKPKTLKIEILPFDNLDFESLLDEMVTHRFIERYEVEGRSYGHVRTWKKHQGINTREWNSGFSLPLPQAGESTDQHVPADASTGKHVSARAVTVPFYGSGSGSGSGSASGSVCGSGSGKPTNPPLEGGTAGSSATPEAEGKGAGKIKTPSVTFDDLQVVWTGCRKSDDDMSIGLPRTGLGKLLNALQGLNSLDRVDEVKAAFASWLDDRYIPAMGSRSPIESPLSVFAGDVKQYVTTLQNKS